MKDKKKQEKEQALRDLEKGLDLLPLGQAEKIAPKKMKQKVKVEMQEDGMEED
jgi:hypothetical protein